ncbi:MAG TPA: ABC transporter permease [Chitinophagaceae bacterium]|nr:ABC transporter permease [Chitinophagaceae bacterium]MCB9056625.1 ABC transporter permease [Chitinophagales bacterium]HPG10674.1 ABC transporter permease [Chitinophagaceae bacterium]
MKQIIILAWRNLWRNRRRTMITLASVFMAVILAIAIRSLQKGVYASMISNAVRFSTGYIQVHAKGYWDDQNINNSFEYDPSLSAVFQKNKDISLYVPRLESFALASSGPHTKGVAVTGIDPEKEDEMNGLAKKIIEGDYFNSQPQQGILIGDGLAEYLQLHLGDTLVLLGQGYHGATAAGQFPIQGIFHYPLDQMNNTMVFLSLPDAQLLFGAENSLTSISLMLQNENAISSAKEFIEKHVDSTYEVMEWPAMNKTLVQEIQGDNAGGIIMLGILYLVVAFGVFGTILMMTMERKKEFAAMIAVGMRRFKLTFMVIFETIFIGLIGIVSGTLIILPILIYFHRHPVALTGAAAETYQQFGIEPVMPASLDPSIFLYQGITVLCIAILSAFYPLWYINRIPVAGTLKQ